MEYAWIQAHRDSYPVTVMCRVLEVSTCGVYQLLTAQPGPRTRRTERIRQAVAEVFQESHSIYGSHKIAKTLRIDESRGRVCRTVAKAMREMGLKSCVSKRGSSAILVAELGG